MHRLHQRAIADKMFSMLSSDLSRQTAPLGWIVPCPDAEPGALRISDRRRAPFRSRQSSDATARLSVDIECLLERDSSHQRHLRTVRLRQRALRERVSSVGWRAYLELEEAEFDRWAHAIERVSRWALERGRRSRGRRGRATRR